MVSKSHLRTKLSRVKGLGAAHHGVGHWIWQRVTAIALVPLLIWFMTQLVGNLLSPNVVDVAQWFASPINTILMVLMLAATFFHAKLGMQVVIEDYVHAPFAKYTLLLANTFICFLFAAVTILATLKLHFLDVGASM